jgi:hypothetical protein
VAEDATFNGEDVEEGTRVEEVDEDVLTLASDENVPLS